MSVFTANSLNILLALSFFFFALRVLYLYLHVRSSRLFVFGFSMLVISLTAVADFVSGFLTFLHVDWFLFVGQVVSLLFVLLSLLPVLDRYLNILMRLQIFAFVLLLLLLIFSPFLSSSSSDPWIIYLGAARSVICFAIFFCYLSVFFHKDTRFSLLMALAFFLLSFGYLLTLPRYVLPDGSLMDMIGDIVRIIGVLILSLSFAAG